MSDLAFSLDDYIKKQKRQNVKTTKVGSPRRKPNNAGGGKRNSQNKVKGGGGGGGNRGLARARIVNPGKGKNNGRRNLNNNVPAGRNRVQTNNKSQFKRTNNRLNQNRNRGGVGASTLDLRTQRFGGISNNNNNKNKNSAQNSPRNFGQGARQRSKKNNWKNNRPIKIIARTPNNNIRNSIPKQIQRNGGRLSVVTSVGGMSSNRRPGNRRLQQLIQKRIKNARSVLASKTIPRNPRVLGTSKGLRSANVQLQKSRNMVSPRGFVAQQKVNRAKAIRTRIRTNKTLRNKARDNRGLSVDRNNMVRVRVANEFSQFSSAGNPYSNTPMPLFGSNIPYPYTSSSLSSNPGGSSSSMDFHRSAPEFPPFTMHNTVSGGGIVDEMEICRSTLDPNIQRKISVIQNRARNSNNGGSPTRITSNFTCPVFTSHRALGDRFRMMMH